MVTFSWEIVDILGVLSFLSKLETPISLVVQYSNYPRIVTGGISNQLVFTVLAALVPKQHSHVNPARYNSYNIFFNLSFFCFPVVCFLAFCFERETNQN